MPTVPNPLRPLWPLLAAALVGCGSPTGPSDRADLLVFGTESGRLLYLDTRAGRVEGAAPFVLDPVLTHAVDAAGTTLYLTAINPAGRELMAIELPSVQVRWRLPMAGGNTAVFYDGVELGADPIAVLPDGHTLIMGGAYRNPTVGLAAFDPIARTVAAFRGPITAYGFTTLPGAGLVAAPVRTGLRTDGRVSTSLMLFGPGTLVPADSIDFDAPYEDPQNVVDAPGADLLYIGNYRRLFAWSRQGRAVMAFTIRQGIGEMVISPDGQSVVVASGPDGPDFPGPGVLSIYDRDLHLQKVIDLSAEGTAGFPPALGQLLFSRDGRWLFVATGTGSGGTLYPAQRSQVIVIDARSWAVARVIHLDDWRAVRMVTLN